MSENGQQENMQQEESFAELMASYEGGLGERLRVGDKVKGRVIAIGDNAVFVDTGTKVDGAVDKSELLDEQGDLPYKEGDELDLYVTSLSNNVITLSRALSGQGGLDQLRDAYENKVPVEGKVKGPVKGGFEVTTFNRRAFCPMSQMDARPVTTPEEYVGQTYSFLVVRFEQNGRNIVVSRRALVEQEQKEASAKFLEEVNAGDVLTGRVVRLAPFGAFVEISPGVEGMVHVSELSWTRVEKPEDAVAVGDQLPVKILSMEKRDKGGQLKISLSAKQAAGDPWEGLAGKYNEGDTVTGKVVRLAPFGAFVELEPGVEGLVHVSEMSYAKRINKPEDAVSVGEEVTAKVKEFDPSKRRIGLSIRDAAGDPWADVPEKFQVGQSVEGVMEKKEQFGMFINLAPGVTGLLPKSRFRDAPKETNLDAKKPGDTVTVIVEEIRPTERKITLGFGGEGKEPREFAGDWKKFAKPQTAAGGGMGMGLLGDKLREAMAAKKK